jgi:capsular polysaccharide transport system permease protein
LADNQPTPVPKAQEPAVTPKAKPAPKPTSKPKPVRPPAQPARIKRRHVLLLLSLIICVIAPAGATGWYLWTQAVDQYTSEVGFTVRREEAPSAIDILGGLSNLSSASSSDSDILFEFIQSQELVKRVDDVMDLRTLYSEPYDIDPLFALKPNSSIEELRNYWQSMVQISYAPGTGLIKLKVFAFNPQDAQTIAQTIFDNSTKMINQLSAIAREDAMRYAREELNAAVEQLKRARQDLTSFRSRTQIVDPSADIQLQMGLLNTLQQQLGEELITYDLLLKNTTGGDPRLTQAKQRITAIRERVRQERQKFGTGGDASEGEDYATLVAEFERLSVDREFAETRYTGALSNFDVAQAEAQRQSRYLAAFVQPTIAESAEYPRRILLLGLATLFLLVGWAILALMYYSLRDRR